MAPIYVKIFYMRHELLNKDEENKLAWCIACNENVRIGLHKRASRKDTWRCMPGHNARNLKYNKPSNHKYRHAVKNYCEACGFVPVDLCQVDVDHIDGNHDNNEESNLQTLCANCHRLKTKLQKDGMYARITRKAVSPLDDLPV